MEIKEHKEVRERGETMKWIKVPELEKEDYEI